MIYIVAIIFPLIAIGCGIVSFTALIKFVVEIQRDIRNQRT
jgi:hypothetical protein